MYKFHITILLLITDYCLIMSIVVYILGLLECEDTQNIDFVYFNNKRLNLFFMLNVHLRPYCWPIIGNSKISHILSPLIHANHIEISSLVLTFSAKCHEVFNNERFSSCLDFFTQSDYENSREIILLNLYTVRVLSNMM